MEEVTVTRKAYATAVPSIGGIGGYVLQDDVTAIRTHTGCEVLVIGTRSYMRGVDVTGDAPRGSHERIVAYWQGEAERWAASAARLSQPDALLIEGGLVYAPGFTAEAFTAGLTKARKADYLQMVPLRNGSIRVDTGKPGSVYQVTRTSCTCRGHMGHGHCYHRAAVIAVADLYEIDVRLETVVGFDTDGYPVTTFAPELQEVA